MTSSDREKPALPPGTLVHVGETRVDSMQIQCLSYDDDTVEETITADVDEVLKLVHSSKGKRLWLRVIGLHEIDKISDLLCPLGIHTLTQEDVLNTKHRPKIEDLGELLYITLKSFVHPEDSERFDIEQISVLIMDGLVVTFQESDTPLLDPLVLRLKQGSGRLRRNGSDYLLWGILDAIVDHYLLCLSAVEAKAEDIDAQLMENATNIDIRVIHSLKSEVLQMQRLIRPSRELVGHLERGESPLVAESNRIYFRDLYDHALRCTEDLDILRESINGLRDYYLSAVSNRMNEVMKVLTCISTIFLPLTFLAGVYGMNFHWMPELGWKAGYPLVWLIFIVAAGIMFYLFRKKKWL